MGVALMLVLTRRAKEALIIDGEVTVKILKISGTQVTIGIDAPKGVPVHREELYNRINGIEANTTPQPISDAQKKRADRESVQAAQQRGDGMSSRSKSGSSIQPRHPERL